ncbi:hypothetical protein RB213_009068 [Colletotrichum asianum]|uniref:Uncharacterized protein n=1 Tax=Colletotrichum asianum TaxID=702518 RepID=A0A8H3ZH25_9PEZI|nr:hypothetical protein GQ607_013882 [Colletotrichum asianum]
MAQQGGTYRAPSRFTFSFGRTNSSTEPFTEYDGSVEEKLDETNTVLVHHAAVR